MTSRLLSAVMLIGLFVPLSTVALTGNEYRAFSDTQCIAWIIGVTDGLSTAELIATNKQPEIAKCFGELEWEQVKAIFEKSLEADPER